MRHEAWQEAANDAEADGGGRVVDRRVVVNVVVVIVVVVEIWRFDVNDHGWEEEETWYDVDRHQVHDEPAIKRIIIIIN